MCGGNEITPEDLPPTVSASIDTPSITIPVGTTLDDAEKAIICENLAANKGNKSKTADILGIGRKTLHRKLQEYGIGDGEAST